MCDRYGRTWDWYYDDCGRWILGCIDHAIEEEWLGVLRYDAIIVMLAAEYLEGRSLNTTPEEFAVCIKRYLRGRLGDLPERIVEHNARCPEEDSGERVVQWVEAANIGYSTICSQLTLYVSSYV